MRIAIATLAYLPLPPTKGGAVETLLECISVENEKYGELEIDVFSIYDDSVKGVPGKQKTEYHYINRKKISKWSCGNVLNKVFKTYKFINVNLKEYVRQINKGEYDYVIATSIFKEVSVVAQKIKAPFIWYLHADALSVLQERYVKEIAENCRAILTVSDFVSNRIREIGVKCPVLTIMNCSGIVPVAKEDEEQITADFRKKYGIDSDDTVFCFVGRIVPIKGIYELVEAFNKVEFSKKKLLIVGSPSNNAEKEYFSKIKSISGENVIFTGYINNKELDRVYCGIDVAVVPSTCNEAAGLSVIEPQLCGRKVIASNMGGIPEYCIDNVLVECNESFVDNLKDAMEDFCKNKQTYIASAKRINMFNQEQYYKDFVHSLNKIKEL